MLKIIEYFAGTAEMFSPSENKNKALSYMQNSNVLFFNLREKDGGVSFKILRKNSRDKELLKYAEIIKTKGFLCDVKKSFRRPGLYVGALLFIAALILSDRIVWDIKFFPGGDENTQRIAAVLQESGLKSGVFKSAVDTSHLENLVMLKCPDVSYVNINLSGGTATVTTDERVTFAKPPDDGKTDLCASEDGYIIRYETYAGRTVCEKGQTVKQGDTLISGSYDTFHHGTVTVKARGRVYALVRRSFLCECDDTVKEKIYTGKQYIRRAFTLFSLKLGKDKEYDPEKYEKTSDIQTVTVFNITELPLKINTDTYREYSTKERKISEAEAEKTLAEMYEKQYKDITNGAEVKNTEIKKYHENGKYCLYCEVILICNIAK